MNTSVRSWVKNRLYFANPYYSIRTILRSESADGVDIIFIFGLISMYVTPLTIGGITLGTTSTVRAASWYGLILYCISAWLGLGLTGLYLYHQDKKLRFNRYAVSDSYIVFISDSGQKRAYRIEQSPGDLFKQAALDSSPESVSISFSDTIGTRVDPDSVPDSVYAQSTLNRV